MFWEMVYIKCGLYCNSIFIYLLSVIFLRDVTRTLQEILLQHHGPGQQQPPCGELHFLVAHEYQQELVMMDRLLHDL